MPSFVQQESKQLLSNMAVFAVSTFVSKAIVFLLLPIYTIYMSTSELGIAELTVNFVNLVFPLTTINILSATLRFAMDGKVDKMSVFLTTWVIIIAGLLLIGLILYGVDISHNIIYQKKYAFALLAAYSVGQIFSVYSKAVGSIKTFAVGNVLYAVFLLGFNLLFIMYLRRGANGYIESLVMSNTLMSLFFFIALYSKGAIGSFRGKKLLIKEMLLFSLPLVMNSISWWLSNYCDRYILNYFEGNGSVGIYAVSAKIPSLISVIASVFMQAWVLSAIKAYEQKDAPVFFSSVAEKFSAFFLIGSSFIIFFSKPLSLLLAKNDFQSSWVYVPFLLCAAVFTNFGNFYSVIYTSAKKNFSVMISTLLGVFLNIILNLLLIPLYSIQGAVLATMISQFFIFLYRMVDSRRFFKFEHNYKKMFIVFLIMLLQAGFIVMNFPWWLTSINCIAIILLYRKELSKHLKSVSSLVKSKI